VTGGLIGHLAVAIGGSFGDLADAAARYGYWAVLLVVAGDGVFPVFPGETAIVAAAVLAADGVLSLPLVIAAGAIGAVLGDSAAFWIGRRGRGPLRRGVVKVAGAGRLEAAERMVSRQGPALVLAGRFLPGIRIAINLSCGAGQMSYPRFLLFDSVGAVLWSTQAAMIGYLAGKAFAEQPWVAFGVAFAVMAAVGSVIGVRERRHVRRERAAAAAADRAREEASPGDLSSPS
jgi:membrane protein DedA with SNARE-associated domain